MNTQRWLDRLLALDPLATLRGRRNRREFARRFPGALISPHSIIPKGDIAIGRGTYGCLHIQTFHPSDRVSIGRYCSIAPEVLILAGGGHRTDLPSTYPFRKKFNPENENTDVVSKGAVVIGNDVWIGARALVLSGVTIGDGAVIAGGSVVVKDIPPFAITGGNPAKVLRLRLPEAAIAAMLRIRWWEWDEERIRREMDGFYESPEAFIRRQLPGWNGAFPP
ncbi:MAG TPA: acetyltransferase [Syntrophus sp. (in: bacteria)]|jgi:acetyltransferase-like isoleucine patch superfamily enzyme|nr:acetyltransferase [Syntrophus sp. (in: bacteria)]